MRHFLRMCLLVGIMMGGNALFAQKVTPLVDPFIGSSSGNVLPGASLPFGLMRLSPDLFPPQPTNGYRPGKPIAGFSHTHTSGTGGGPRYGNFLLFPQTGPPDLVDRAPRKQVNERAHPGYYGVTLARRPGDVAVELTATQHVGVHRYRFFRWGEHERVEGSLFLDVGHSNTRAGQDDARCLEGAVQFESARSLSGYGRFAGGWGGQLPYTVYFWAECDRPFDRRGMWQDTTLQVGETALSREFGENDAVPRAFGAWLGFDLPNEGEVELRVSISLLSREAARANLEAEAAGKTFAQLRYAADSVWESQLNRIQVTGGLPEQQRLFYSCLRNTLLMPTDLTGENPLWESDAPHYWEHYCLWDVFRTVMQLHSLILPERQRSIIRGLLDIYAQRDWLPDAWVAGGYGSTQGGTNADVVLADAIVKDLGGFDYALAYEAMQKNAEVESSDPQHYGRYLADYLALGYVTAASTNGASSRTLEYAYNDYCLAQVAAKLGHEAEAARYRARAQGVFQLFHPEEKHFWAKDRQGAWMPDFSPESRLRDHWNDPYFYEGGSRTYSAYVPHDMAELIARHGGPEAFVAYLDGVFASGFDLGNEPLFLLPYQYLYAGRADKAAEWVRAILDEQFLPTAEGFPGQDDSGAMSAWYVWSALGLFPVAGQPVYLIGSPVFDRVEMQLEGGKSFTVEARHGGPGRFYVQAATLNGQPLARAWLRHDELAAGGTLVLEMGDKPTGWGRGEVPPSMGE